MPMFSSDMLANIIRYYGHAMQGLMGSYLERSIFTFHEAQKRFQEQAQLDLRRAAEDADRGHVPGQPMPERDGRLPREGRQGRDRHAGGAAQPGAQALLGIPVRGGNGTGEAPAARQGEGPKAAAQSRAKK